MKTIPAALWFSLLATIILPLTAVPQFFIPAGAAVTTTGNISVVLNNIDLKNDGGIAQLPGNGRLVFTGNNNNNISGNSIPLFDILEIAKTGTAKLSLAQNTSVGSQLLFTSGLLNLNTKNLVLQPGAEMVNETEISHAADDAANSGQLTITQIINASSTVNPGNLGVEINTGSIAMGSTIITRYCGPVTVNGSNSGIIHRYYKVEPTINTGLNASARFYYLDTELNGVDPSTAVLWKSSDNGNTWATVAPDARNTSSKYLQKNNINDFSLWSIAAPNSALPVIFSSFNTSCTGNGALLQWSTGFEINTAYFIVEKSEDGISWNELTRMTASGTASDYHFDDGLSGEAFYRLKEVDKNGSATDSKIIRSNCGIQSITVLLYPNPANTSTNLVFSSLHDMKTNILVLDAAGRLIKQIPVVVQRGSNHILISLQGLATGNYHIAVKEKELNITKQLFVH